MSDRADRHRYRRLAAGVKPPFVLGFGTHLAQHHNARALNAGAFECPDDQMLFPCSGMLIARRGEAQTGVEVGYPAPSMPINTVLASSRGAVCAANSGADTIHRLA